MTNEEIRALVKEVSTPKNQAKLSTFIKRMGTQTMKASNPKAAGLRIDSKSH